MSDLIKWAPVTSSAWRPSFAQTKSGLETQFVGECPRCAHETSIRVTLVNPNPGGHSTKSEGKNFTMLCRCGYQHPGHPDGDDSCGAYWLNEIKP
jgi:hypothetical protein